MHYAKVFLCRETFRAIVCLRESFHENDRKICIKKFYQNLILPKIVILAEVFVFYKRFRDNFCYFRTFPKHVREKRKYFSRKYENENFRFSPSSDIP
jgi:hypothetical protein